MMGEVAGEGHESVKLYLLSFHSMMAILLSNVQHDMPRGQCHTRISFKLFVCF